MKNVEFFYITSELFNNEKFVKEMTNSDFIFYKYRHNLKNFNYLKKIEGFKKYNPNFNFKKNFIHCSPTLEIHNKITSEGYSSILLNHNSFLDYNLFKLETINENNRVFNAVINSRPHCGKGCILPIK